MTRSISIRTALLPADGLVAPIPLVALAAWIANDRVFKTAWPGPVTGKLSDVAGLVVAPLALVAVWEVALWAAGRWTGPTRLALVVAIAAVGIGFAAAELSAPATDAYRWGLGIAQWPLRVVAASFGSGPALGVVPVRATPDLGDLLALPALAVTWMAGRRRTTPPA